MYVQPTALCNSSLSAQLVRSSSSCICSRRTGYILLPIATKQAGHCVSRVKANVSACAGQEYPTAVTNSNYDHFTSASKHGEHCLQVWPNAMCILSVDRPASGKVSPHQDARNAGWHRHRACRWPLGFDSASCLKSHLCWRLFINSLVGCTHWCSN